MKDIILNSNYDISIELGDFVVEDSSIQHQALLLLCDKNDYKENPDSCIGSRRFAENHNSEAYAREISQQFSADGLKVNKIVVDIAEIKIEANYED